ncbi:MAG: C1 family peptidase [Candidatus Krumholzibacteriia bacterium]
MREIPAAFRQALPGLAALVLFTVAVASVAAAGPANAGPAAAGPAAAGNDAPEPSASRLEFATLQGAAQAPDANGRAGFVPPSLPAAHLAPVATAKAADLPARWDWREHGAATPVRDQGGCGACYAFGAAGELEAQLLLQGAGSVDLSENSIKECNYQQSSCGGGHQYLVYNFLTRAGVTDEACDPYQDTDVTCATGCPYLYTPLNWYAVSGSVLPDVAALKEIVHAHGPVQTTVYTGGDGALPSWRRAFSDYDGVGCLYLADEVVPDHSVLIVGYDDDVAHAGGTGAWIVKNSWGTAWGGTCGHGSERGYFLIAYGSAGIGKWSSRSAEVIVHDPHHRVLGHDEAGLTQHLGTGSSTTIWGMARIVPTEAAYLQRVEFWTTDACSGAEVHVYGAFAGGKTSELLSRRTGLVLPHAGYHSVALPDALPLAAGEPVYVVVKFANLTYTLPLPVDHVGPRTPGTSFVGLDGSNWSDLASYSVDVGIRARVSQDPALGVDDETGEDESSLPRSLRLAPAVPNPFNPRTTIRFELPLGGPTVVGVYDLTGRCVHTLVNEHRAAGLHQTSWNGRDAAGRPLPAGVYVARLETVAGVRSTKLILVK